MGNKEKYLKYRAKYLQLTSNQTGGLSWGKFTTYFSSKPTVKSTLEKYSHKIGKYYYDYDTDNIITFNISYNNINYVINQVNLHFSGLVDPRLDYDPHDIIYCINLKDNIPHSLLVLSKNCEKIENSNRVNPVRVNKRYYESNNYENDRLIISGIIEQIIIKCNNDKGLKAAFEEKKRKEDRERSNAEWQKMNEEYNRQMREKINSELPEINQSIRSIIGSSVKIDTVKLPINEGLCYKQYNKNYGKFKKYEYDGSRGDPIYVYYFENGIISIDPMEKNDKDIVNVIECNNSEPVIDYSPPPIYNPPPVYSPIYGDRYSVSPEKYSEKVTIDYVKMNPNECYQYYNKYYNKLVYLGKYIRDARGSGKSDYITYHYFENGNVTEDDTKYYEIVNCGTNRSEV